MSEPFDTFVALVLEHEGGYANDPDDPGGETKYGISKRSYPHLDIKNLTRAQAAEIYFRDFWTAPGLDSLPAAIALVVLDFGVNAGIETAVKALQAELAVTIDGDLGPVTARVAATANRGYILAALTSRRLVRFAYNGGAFNPKFAKYGRTWVDRALHTYTAALHHV